MNNSVQIVAGDADLKDVVPILGERDVVLAVGLDNRLQGTVTSWDLAEEFAQLVDPFKCVGEIEERLRTLVRRGLNAEQIANCLSDHSSVEGKYQGRPEESMIGELQRVLRYLQHWGLLRLIAIERATFIDALTRVRGFRNKVMHFRDPL